MRLLFSTLGTTVVKDIKIFFRYKSFVVAIFFWPLFFPLTFFFFGKGMAGPQLEGIGHFQTLTRTADYASYLVFGSLAWMFVNLNLWQGGLSLRKQQIQGILETHWSTPAPKLGFLLGSTASSILLTLLPIGVAVGVLEAAGILHFRGNLLSALGAFLLSLPFFLGFLLCFSALTLRIREANALVQAARSLLSLICGFQFPFAVLPRPVQWLGSYIPLKHSVDLMRGLVFQGRSLSEYAASIRYLLASGLLFLGIGVLFFGLLQQGVKKRGLVSHY